MSTLEYTVHSIRRGWRVTRTFVFTGAFAAAFVGGVFSDITAKGANRTLPIVLMALWTLVFGLKAHKRASINGEGRDRIQSRLDLEIGLLLVVATHAVVQMVGGLDSPFYPVVFILIAFLVVYMPQWVGFTLVGAAIVVEAALAFFGAASFVQVAFHSVFIVFFALINLIFTRTEMAKIKLKSKKQIEKAKAEMEVDARDFRLTAPACGGRVLSREEEQARLAHATVSEVRRSMYHHVDLLKRTMSLHSCVVLWLDGAQKKLRVLECVSDADELVVRTIEKGEGVLGAILQSKKPLRLKGLRPGYPGLAYYLDDTPVTDFLGVPILEGGGLRGVICADRTAGKEFTARGVETLVASVESLVQIVANERIFTQLQKAKSEQGKLLAASEQLAHVISEKDVVTAALEAAAQIVSFDIAALALIGRNGKQVVQKAVGDRAEEIEGISPAAGNSLVSAALKNMHFLPYRGDLDPKQQIVFSKKSQKVFSKMNSAMVLPLISGDKPLGTLTLAACEPSVFNEEVRTTLQVMTNQLGASLLNARMVRRLQEMATIDGLTGLSNRRVFEEEMDKKLASCQRFNKELSVVFCDVDKFKNVNDTYGHAVGDVVLAGLGETLIRNVVRETDLPARYGGEEFVILCEGTETDGAVKLAERIREDLESQVFHSEQGEFRVTISMGVATFPIHAHNKDVLVERADTALYAAKEGGRNQVRVWKNGMMP